MNLPLRRKDKFAFVLRAWILSLELQGYSSVRSELVEVVDRRAPTSPEFVHHDYFWMSLKPLPNGETVGRASGRECARTRSLHQGQPKLSKETNNRKRVETVCLSTRVRQLSSSRVCFLSKTQNIKMSDKSAPVSFLYCYLTSDKLRQLEE